MMQSALYHGGFGSAVILGLFFGWWVLWVPTLVWYSIYESAWWLVLLAILIDAYYGAFYAIPYQSLLAFSIAVLMELLRPYLFTST